MKKIFTLIVLFSGIITVCSDANKHLDNFQQFCEAAAIEKALHNICCDYFAGTHYGTLKKFEHTPYVQIPPSGLPIMAQQGHYLLVCDESKTLKLQGIWGISTIVKELDFELTPEGLDSSGPFDKEIMKTFGLTNAGNPVCENPGYGFLVDGSSYAINQINQTKIQPIAGKSAMSTLYLPPLQSNKNELEQYKLKMSQLTQARAASWAALNKKYENNPGEKVPRSPKKDADEEKHSIHIHWQLRGSTSSTASALK